MIPVGKTLQMEVQASLAWTTLTQPMAPNVPTLMGLQIDATAPLETFYQRMLDADITLVRFLLLLTPFAQSLQIYSGPMLCLASLSRPI